MDHNPPRVKARAPRCPSADPRLRPSATVFNWRLHPHSGQLNLLPRYLFLITNWPRDLRSAEDVLAHYRKRGTFEDRLGEFNEAIGPHLSSREFVENEVTMLLALLAFNMTSMLRNEFEDALGGCWDLRRFQQSVLQAGGRVVKHSRRLWLHVEQSSPPRLGSTTFSRAPIVGSARLSSRRSAFLFLFFITKRHSPWGKGGRVRSIQPNPISAHAYPPQCLTHSTSVNNLG